MNPSPTVINDKVAFPEGPVFVGQALYFVEFGLDRVTRQDPDGATVLWTQAGSGPAAVCPFGGTDLLVACFTSNTVVRITLGGQTLATYDRCSRGLPFQGPNDFAPDGRGGVWFTASGPGDAGSIVGKLYHIDADATISEVADDLHYPNGLCLSGDGRRLLVAESEAARIISFAVDDAGNLTDRRLFLRMAEVDALSGFDAFPDGLKLGPDGNYYIGQYSKARIVVVDAVGQFVRAIDLPGAAAPNLTFSPDCLTIYALTVEDKGNAPYWGKVWAMPV